MLRVLFFASLREQLGLAEQALDVPVPATVGALVTQLRARGEPWSEVLAAGKRWRVAVNQDMATLATPLKSGDEIAIFPPVTGG